MKYLFVEIEQRSGGYENVGKCVRKVEDSIDLDDYSHTLAKEERGSDDSDWDKLANGYQYSGGEGVVLLAEITEISKGEYDILKKYL